MLPDISEFSYGFALVNELIHHHGIQLAGAPSFPTQNEEGTVGGYDVMLPQQGVPIFLQIKRSECLTRRSAGEWQELGLPYYRFHLRPRKHSRQHELLLVLEQQNPEVYYAAPRFHLPRELDDAYQSNNVWDRSVWVKPSSIGPLPDPDDHYVSVSSSGGRWLFCSRKPRELEARSTNSVRREINEALAKRSKRLDSEFLNELGDTIVDSYVRLDVYATLSQDELGAPDESLDPETLGRKEVAQQRERAVRRKAKEVRDRNRAAEYAREVANTLLGCELLFAARPS